MTAPDLATLALRLTNEPAIAGAQATGRAFDDMGNKAEAAGRKIERTSGIINPVTDALKKQEAAALQSARALTFMQGGLAGITPQFGTVAREAEAAATSVGGLGTALSGIGSIGILFAIQSIVTLIERWASAAGKARREQEALTKALADQFAPKTGPESETVKRYEGALAQQADANMRLRLIMGAGNDIEMARAFQGAGLAVPWRSREDEQARETARLAQANVAIDRARQHGAEELPDVRVRDPYDRAKAEREATARDKFAAEARVRADELAWRQETYKREARQLKLVPDSVIKPLDSLLTPALVRAAKAAETLSNSFENSKLRLQQGIEGWKPGNIGGGIVSGVTGGIGDALSRFSPANLAASGVSYLLETGLKGVASMLGDLFSSGKAAAENARRMAFDFKVATDLFHAAAVGDTLLAAITQQQAAYEARKIEIENRYKVQEYLGHPTNRAADLAAAAADEAVAEARIRAQHAHDVQYATEDLAVRNLRATGQGSQADLLAFQNQQAREMQAAIDANRDATYLSYLATVQNNELLAYQNGLLQTAMRNAPTGFYGIEQYLGAYADRRGALGGESGGGVNPLSPVNPTGGLTPPGGSSRRPMTVQLLVDGKVFAQAFVDQVDQKAASTGGAGTSRAQALELM